jgi:hypothetical protein
MKYKGKLKPKVKVKRCPRCNQHYDIKELITAYGWFNAPISFCKHCHQDLADIY